MQDTIYVLSIREVLEETIQAGELLNRALEKLDSERRQKAERLKLGAKRAESIGAGLLIQYALRCAVLESVAEKQVQESSDMCDVRMEFATANSTAEALKDGNGGTIRVQSLGFTQILAELDDAVVLPYSIEYEYGANGKPYFKNYPYYFNVSHSGEYVICGISDREIGVDIQAERSCDIKHLSERFFSQAEKRMLKECALEAERNKLFYELWTEKEAYGKLTGEGIIASAGVDIRGQLEREDVSILQLFAPAGYKMAVCVRK